MRSDATDSDGAQKDVFEFRNDVDLKRVSYEFFIYLMIKKIFFNGIVKFFFKKYL